MNQEPTKQTILKKQKPKKKKMTKKNSVAPQTNLSSPAEGNSKKSSIETVDLTTGILPGDSFSPNWDKLKEVKMGNRSSFYLYCKYFFSFLRR